MKKEEILSFARKNWVPVLRDRSADFLCEVVKKEKPKKILEIGTCLGYSGILMLENSQESFLVTVEKDVEKSREALQNFSQAGLLDRVEVINQDAMEVIQNLVKNEQKFDLIFLDGPKGQYVKYLPNLKQLLNRGGILFADDIYYHGLVKQGYPKHKHRTIVYRLREFIDLITNDKEFETFLFDIDDGFSLSYLK